MKSVVFARLAETFETDPRWLWRVLAAGACGLVIAAEVLWQGGAKLTSSETIAQLIMLPAFYLAGGCLLATKDTVDQRMRSGRSIGRLFRILFGMRGWSLVLWITVFLIAGFPLAVVVGNLTWK